MAAITAVLLAQQASNPIRPALATLTDDFATADTAKWNFGAAATVTGGQLVLTPNTSYSGEARGIVAYDLTSSAAVVELVQRPNLGNGTTETIVALYQDDVNAHAILFDLSGANLLAISRNGAGNVFQGSATYDATAHRWLRIRETAGTVYWDTSPDRSTWTNLGTWAPVFPVTALYPLLTTGYYGTETSPGSSIFDNFNVAPPETHTTTGTATATAAGAGATATTRAKTATASATATATRAGSSTRTKTATATATATASGTTSSTTGAVTVGTALATAAASSVTTTTRTKTGTATATSSRSATTSTTRTRTATATATASASAVRSTIRTTARTATATAGATATTATVRSKTGIATLLAGATALTTTGRTSAGTGTAYATASGITGQGSAERDITLTIGPGRSRSLTASGASRGLTATGTASRSLTAEATSRELAAAGRSRTLTIRPRE